MRSVAGVPTVLVLTPEQAEELIRAAVSRALEQYRQDLENDVQRNPLLSVRGLAQALGSSPSSVHRLLHRGLPHVRVGESPRFDLAQVRAWLEQNGRSAK